MWHKSMGIQDKDYRSAFIQKSKNQYIRIIRRIIKGGRDMPVTVREMLKILKKMDGMKLNNMVLIFN